MIPHTVGTLFLFVNLVFAVAWECAPLLAKTAFLVPNRVRSCSERTATTNILIQGSPNQLVLDKNECNAIKKQQELKREFLGLKACENSVRNPVSIDLLIGVRNRARVVPETSTVDEVHHMRKGEAWKEERLPRFDQTLELNHCVPESARNGASSRSNIIIDEALELGNSHVDGGDVVAFQILFDRFSYLRSARRENLEFFPERYAPCPILWPVESGDRRSNHCRRITARLSHRLDQRRVISRRRRPSELFQSHEQCLGWVCVNKVATSGKFLEFIGRHHWGMWIAAGSIVQKIEIDPQVHETRKEQKIRGRYPIDRGRYEPFASGDKIRGVDRIAGLQVGASRSPTTWI
jgi:hypothetical protein